jgi:hypothetical protein
LSGDQLISTQSIPPRLISEVLSPQIAPLSRLLLPKLSTLVDCCLGWVAPSILHVAGHPSPTHCCHPIVVVQSPLFYHCPQKAAVVVDIAAVGSGGGIVTIAVAVAVAIAVAVSAIAVIAVIVDIASIMLHVIIVVIMLFGGQS